MRLSIESALTTVGLVSGYVVVALVVVGAMKPVDGLRSQLAAAAAALLSLFAVFTAAFVITEAWLSTESPHSPPMWLEATNKASENMLSEVFQVWLAALVFKHLRWPGTPESK